MQISSVVIAWALLDVRVVAGLTLAAHGAQKAFGWFGGTGYDGLMQSFGKQGFRPAWFWSPLVILGELGGGLSLALGFLTPLGAAGAVGAMVMAILKVHWPKGFFSANGGFEFPLQLLAVAVAVGLVGPGAYSLDTLLAARLHLALPQAPLFGALAFVALVVDVIGLLVSRPVGAPAAKPRTA